MNSLRTPEWLIIISSIAIAFLLTVLPIPAWAEPFRPAWVMMVMLYWVIILPHRINLFFAWLIGICADLSMGTLLGENALIYLVIAYLAVTLHRYIRLLTRFRQMLVILFLLYIANLLLFWIQSTLGQVLTAKWFWLSPLSSVLLWPWIFMVLTDYSKRYHLR